mmetsp:Transcript_4723/g.8525  ORF Transcript_4723/g.8525 Transcript_4723/m.8525 type:complete len:212 (+) Transcript_4723:430-1065(+)
MVTTSWKLSTNSSGAILPSSFASRRMSSMFTTTSSSGSGRASSTSSRRESDAAAPKIVVRSTLGSSSRMRVKKSLRRVLNSSCSRYPLSSASYAWNICSRSSYVSLIICSKERRVSWFSSPSPMSTSAKPNANSSSESSTRCTPSCRMRSYQAWTFPANAGFCFMMSLPKAASRKGRELREPSAARAIGCSVAACGSVISMSLPKSSTPAM